VFDLWEDQPDALKAAGVAALVAIVGLIVNSVVTGWTTSRQLKHDREEKAKERSLSLRREIYLGVAEHFQRGSLFLMRMADLELDPKEPADAVLQTAHYMAKMYLVANPPLIKAVAEGSNALMGAMFRMRLGRDQAAPARATLQAKRAALAQFNGVGGVAARLPLANEHDVALQSYRVAASQLMFAAQREVAAMWPHIRNMAVAARNELNEPIDAAVFDEVTAALVPQIDQQTVRRMYGLPEALTPEEVSLDRERTMNHLAHAVRAQVLRDQAGVARDGNT
jgi:hypothetical protein